MNKRRLTFSLLLMISIGLDMVSTHLLVGSGYKELTGIFVLIMSVSKWLLHLWTILWTLLVYWLYPFIEKKGFKIHLETMILLWTFFSIIAVIGNFYLYSI